MMQNFLNTVTKLFKLEDSPEKLPYSWPLLFILTAIHWGLRWARLSIFPNTEQHNLFLVALLWLSLNLSLIYGLLYVKKLTDRWLKMTIALLSVEVACIIIIKISMMFIILLSLQSLKGLVVGALFVWIFIVKAYIYQKGLGVNFIIGLLCAISIEAVSNLPILIIMYNDEHMALFQT